MELITQLVRFFSQPLQPPLPQDTHVILEVLLNFINYYPLFAAIACTSKYLETCARLIRSNLGKDFYNYFERYLVIIPRCCALPPPNVFRKPPKTEYGYFSRDHYIYSSLGTQDDWRIGPSAILIPSRDIMELSHKGFNSNTMFYKSFGYGLQFPRFAIQDENALADILDTFNTFRQFPVAYDPNHGRIDLQLNNFCFYISDELFISGCWIHKKESDSKDLKIKMNVYRFKFDYSTNTSYSVKRCNRIEGSLQKDIPTLYNAPLTARLNWVEFLNMLVIIGSRFQTEIQRVRSKDPEFNSKITRLGKLLNQISVLGWDVEEFFASS